MPLDIFPMQAVKTFSIEKIYLIYPEKYKEPVVPHKKISVFHLIKIKYTLIMLLISKNELLPNLRQDLFY